MGDASRCLAWNAVTSALGKTWQPTYGFPVCVPFAPAGRRSGLLQFRTGDEGVIAKNNDGMGARNSASERANCSRDRAIISASYDAISRRRST